MFFGGGMPPGFEEHMHGGGGRGGRQQREPANTTALYEVLEVDKKATASQIKKAYFSLARVKHPDKGGDAEEFKKIQGAYEVLKDPEMRAKYDEGGLEALEGGDMPEGADDIFSAMFGGGRRRRGGGGGGGGPKKGPDVKHPLKVSLEDLYNGKTAKLAVSRDKIVGKPQTCAECNGRGVIVRLRQIGPGMVQQLQQQCPECNATGSSCKKVKERQVLEVVIEKGMKNGGKIKFRGASDEQPNAEPGDIVFVLQEKEHPVFTRKNNDLLIQKQVTLNEALCGYKFVVKTLDGRDIVIQSNPGEILKPDSEGNPCIKCVYNEGMPKEGSPFEKGRLFIYFSIKFPEPGQLGDEELATLRTVLPPPPKCAPYNEEEAETYTTEPISDFKREFGKKDAGGSDAYDSDEEGGGGAGGVQCQQG